MFLRSRASAPPRSTSLDTRVLEARQTNDTPDVPTAAVVIVTFNRAERLRRAIRSVYAQQPVVPLLVVVDNASTDHTPAVLEEECPDATLIRLTENLGCSAGRNIGAAATQASVLFFLDDDGELTPPVVAAAADIILADRRIGALVVTVLENGRPLRFRQTAARTFTHNCQGQGAVRREAFLAVGKYPANFFYGAEETDLSLRLLDAGYDIVFEPSIVTLHTPDQQTRRPWSHVEARRNMLRVVLMRAPVTLLVPWAAKKFIDTMVAAARTRTVRAVVAELAYLPATVLRSLRDRRPLEWDVFAIWRYLAVHEVTDSRYRTAAAREYPGRWSWLFKQMRDDWKSFRARRSARRL
jgi:GT2 family glycosyltransferase